MTNTVNNLIPFVPENTTDPAAGLNLSLYIIDMLLNVSVETVGDNAPPATPNDGDRYIVGTSATGAWAGHENELAMWIDNGSYWEFRAAYSVYNKADSAIYVYATMWQAYAVSANTKKTINTQTDSYTVVLLDAGKIILMNSATANDVTIPPESSENFDVGSFIDVVQLGAGQTSFVAGSGVTILNPFSALTISEQYATARITKISSDTWLVSGNITA